MSNESSILLIYPVNLKAQLSIWCIYISLQW